MDAFSPANIGTPVIDTNTLRQAALQKSWQRDQRVARRRVALRWVLWWLWKCRYYLLIACAVVAYLLYRSQHDLRVGIQPQVQAPAPSASNTAAPAAALPIPLQLKPETQLKTKETNP